MSNFDALWTVAHRHVDTVTEEIELIAQAAQGNEQATHRLFESYVPNLRGAVRRYSAALPADDAQQAAYVGFLEAIRAFDATKSDRLVSILHRYVTAALSREASLASGGFTVAPRMLDRFYSILREADGDPEQAAKLAPTRDRDAMPEATFWDIYAALAAGRSLEQALELNGEEIVSDLSAPREMTDAEDRILVEIAFSAVDDVETKVCRLAYGFEEYDPVPDAEIGHRLGFSRTKALRIRNGALVKMREAIGATDA